ncbi:transcriptional regulator GlcC [Burkholderia sp. WAC0059]|uniref:transcriptional regulator GlcC n=1 Tax=Burkholderia sp. WAC0059 TaxID=2066022 RepID=UPI000C7EAF2C|nr:transcriptional regulator GlcC [Burkholderia sp. WAC0059]PLZ04281.1 transcriptional regulator GlcC [Burkholderia sp. WAC0059]
MAGGQAGAHQVADGVAERIERLVVDGVLKAGQALPSERRLTERLGVSRTALREGLKLLRARGVIETAHGKGSFVAGLNSHQALTPLMHLLGSQPRTLYDLFEVREMLEAESAGLAAERGTPADFALIAHRYREMTAAHHDGASATTHARLDHAFHLAICEASHNAVLVHTLRSLTDLLLSSVFASVNNLYHREAQKRAIDRQHARLFQAVTGRQPVEARKLAGEHIRSVADELRDIEQDERQLVRATLRLENWR